MDEERSIRNIYRNKNEINSVDVKSFGLLKRHYRDDFTDLPTIRTSIEFATNTQQQEEEGVQPGEEQKWEKVTTKQILQKHDTLLADQPVCAFFDNDIPTFESSDSINRIDTISCDTDRAFGKIYNRIDYEMQEAR